MSNEVKQMNIDDVELRVLRILTMDNVTGKQAGAIIGELIRELLADLTQTRKSLAAVEPERDSLKLSRDSYRRDAEALMEINKAGLSSLDEMAKVEAERDAAREALHKIANASEVDYCYANTIRNIAFAALASGTTAGEKT